MTVRLDDGAEMFCVDEGRGPVVLLVHGFPLDHRMWEAQIAALAGSHRVLAPDLRGLGRSAGALPVVTMQRFADDLSLLLDVKGARDPVVLCGLSMGGYIALEFWRRHRARVGRRVLCDTRAGADAPEAAAARRATAERVLAEGPEFLADAMIPKLLSPETADRKPEVERLVRRMISESPREGVAGASLGMAERLDGEPLLPEIDCPALLVVGEHDALTPPSLMGRMAEAMPQACLAEIASAGHLAPLENPADVHAALLAFLGAA